MNTWTTVLVSVLLSTVVLAIGIILVGVVALRRSARLRAYFREWRKATPRPSIFVAIAGALAIIVGLAVTPAAPRAEAEDSQPTTMNTLFNQLRTPRDSSVVSPLDLHLQRVSMDTDFFGSRLPLTAWTAGMDLGIKGGQGSERVDVAGTAITQTYTAGLMQYQNASDAKTNESLFVLGQAHPFGTVDLDVRGVAGSGSISIVLMKGTNDRIHVSYNPTGATFRAEYVKNGAVAEVGGKKVSVSKATNDATYNKGFVIKAQFMGSGVNFWALRGDKISYLGYLNTINAWDFRKGGEDLKIAYGIRGTKGFDVKIGGFSQYLSGSGHADLRVVSFEDGSPIQEGNYVWVLATTRGKEIKDAYQGIYRVDVSTGEISMTGALFGDPGDGSYRNDNAGHLLYDRTADEWVWTNTGHSAYPGWRANFIARMPYDPRAGISHVPVTEIQMPQTEKVIEDFYPVRNLDGTWSATASKDFSISVRMSAPAIEGPWVIEASAGVKETGNIIILMKGKRFILAGVETGYIVRDYDTLAELGRLKVTGSPNANRVWPALFVTTDAQGRERWAMLSFDRSAFSGAYSYGRWYYYLAKP